MSRELALRRARTMREAILDHGVPQVSIELYEGRPTSGANRWSALQPVAAQSHHIASHPTPDNPTPGLSLVKRGRSDLAGPLCNGTGGVDLIYRIICLGWANHPGVGGPWTVRGPLGSYRIPEDVGRPYIWGTEYEGGYTDAVWDKVYTHSKTKIRMDFHEFMARANAGILEGIWAINGKGKTPTTGMDLSTYHGEHGNPWAKGRKPDRRGYVSNVEIGRNLIRRYANSSPGLNKEDDDMSLEENLYPGKKMKDKSVRKLFQELDKFMDGSYQRDRAILSKLTGAQGDLRKAIELVDTLPNSAEQKSTLKMYLEGLAVNLQVVVNETPDPEATP